MTDKPILFSGPMVQAILREIREPGAGKTQTRRVLKTQSIDGYSANGNLVEYEKGLKHGLEFTHIVHGLWHPESNPNGKSAWYVPVPFRTGQRLWVRETWREWHDVDTSCGCSDHCACSSSTAHPAAYRADGDELDADDREAGLKWKPSIFMPRWASRITLEVTDVRVQRLQEISEADAIAEGVEWIGEHDRDASDAFSRLWDSLNADRAPWASNPWVCAVTFRPHLTNIDKMEKAG
ncbi:hypothetical protein [Tritonibacter mobilis]|uniref:hypothetical protein n=1 Tax=Tritonibacter mobilis TaxID=379347 RepID=UPI000806D039|nr:hypothetical protein [Tritonibacter mobilis]